MACGPGKGGEKASDTKGKGEVVASYGSHQLTLDDFQAEVDKLPEQVRPMLSSPERRKQFLETFILSQLLIEEAKKKGLDKDEEIRKQVEETEKRLLLQRAYGDLQQAVTVTDPEIEAYFSANPDEFSTSEIRASHILVEDEATAKDLLSQARANPDSFEKLAKENSKDTATAAERRRSRLLRARTDGSGFRDGRLLPPAARRHLGGGEEPLRLPHHQAHREEGG